ncbi:MAG: VOC family protein [Alicyclobacillus sp.]|nr:VOC family protein [Alicyclobacillus sp.]
MIHQIYGIPVIVSDQDRALEFYREVLGMTVTMDVQTPQFRWLTVSAKDHPETNFILGSSPEDKVGTSWGIVLYCDDLEQSYAGMVAKGVEFIQPPTRMEVGVYLAQFRDPDGNTFQLVQNRR